MPPRFRNHQRSQGPFEIDDARIDLEEFRDSLLRGQLLSGNDSGHGKVDVDWRGYVRDIGQRGQVQLRTIRTTRGRFSDSFIPIEGRGPDAQSS